MTRFTRDWEPWKLPLALVTRTSGPTLADLAPEIRGKYAREAIIAARAEQSAGRLHFYRHRGVWQVYLPDSVLPGGDRVSLKEWAVKWFPDIRFEYPTLARTC